MKLKSILSTSSLLVVLTILISSCGSTLNITKKRHSNGYYVNIGSDNYDNKSKPDTKKSDKKNQSEFIKDKTNNENLASNLEEGEADGKNLKQGENVNKKNSSAEQIASADFSKMSTLKKIKALKKLKKQGKLDDDRDFMFVLLILLSIILSPLAVFLHGNGVTNHFWINLLMWILGVSFAGAFMGSGLAILGILWLVAVVHALLYVFGIIS